MPGEKTTIRTTCPRDCYDSLRHPVVKRDGVITKVLGDPDHPVSRGALCGKCAIAYNGVWRDPAQRLTSRSPDRPQGRGPLRAGQLGRGDRRRSPARLTGIVARARPGADLARPLHRHLLEDRRRLSRCASSTGWAPARSSRTAICNKAGHVALDYMYGSSLTGFDPRTAQGRRLHPGVGRQPVGLGAARPQALAAGVAGPKIVVDPMRHADGRGGRPASPALPGQRCGAGLRHAACDPARWAARPRLSGPPHHRLGRGRAGLDACTPAWGERSPACRRALIEQAARLYGRGPVAAVARPGPAAPADGRQRLARLRAAAGGDRQHRQAGRRLLLPQRRRPQGHRRRRI